MDKRDEKLLRMLSEAVTSAPLEDRAAALRVLDAALGLLNSRAALAHSAHWFLENRTVAATDSESLRDEPDLIYAKVELTQRV